MATEDLTRFLAAPAAEWLADPTIVDTFVDPAGLAQFWLLHYLEALVPQGYGKVKFVIGEAGTGKSHFLRYLQRRAEAMGYVTVAIDARAHRLSGIDELWRALAHSFPWQRTIEERAWRIVRRLYEVSDYQGSVEEFPAYWAEYTNLDVARVRSDLRIETDRWLKTVEINRTFSGVLRQAVMALWRGEGIDPVALAWLRGERVGAQDRGYLGVSTAVNRRNARTLLSSLGEWAHAVGRVGLWLCVDNLDVLTRPRRNSDLPYYTRSQREQAYEMIRELIDDSVHMPYCMATFAGAAGPLEDTRTGLPSYPALWSRVESEVRVARHINRWADLVNLGEAWASEPDALERLAARWQQAPLQWAVGAPEWGGSELDAGWATPRARVREVVTMRVSPTAGGISDE
ncbi:MAG: ATP-binding protein [Firmicutes bacterium]|nr:ATP-binding protein [Bacillota bacterium]